VNGAANTETEEPAATELGCSDPADQVAVSAAEGYARWAPLYDQDPNPLLAREERHLLPLLADLRHKRILDLACGTGRWLEKLMVADGAWAVGLDRSEPMLRVAARKGPIAGRLTRASCESLPFRAGVFDLTICSFALGHIEDLGSMARELARVTKPAADIFVSDLHPDAYEYGWRVGFRDQNAAVQIETVPRSAKETVQALDAHGFECVTQSPLWLGEPEKPLFARAGKSDRFASACQSPAVLVFHFKRTDSNSNIEGAQ
jgi:ubiquinone/menaquinone biosynthesis C-methylase UbiE